MTVFPEIFRVHDSFIVSIQTGTGIVMFKMMEAHCKRFQIRSISLFLWISAFSAEIDYYTELNCSSHPY